MEENKNEFEQPGLEDVEPGFVHLALGILSADEIINKYVGLGLTEENVEQTIELVEDESEVTEFLDGVLMLNQLSFSETDKLPFHDNLALYAKWKEDQYLGHLGQFRSYDWRDALMDLYVMKKEKGVEWSYFTEILSLENIHFGDVYIGLHTKSDDMCPETERKHVFDDGKSEPDFMDTIVSLDTADQLLNDGYRTDPNESETAVHGFIAQAERLGEIDLNKGILRNQKQVKYF